MNIKRIVTGMMAGAAVFSLVPSNVYAENKDVEVISEAAYQQDYSRLWGQVSEFDELGRIRITNSSDVNNDVILNINEDTIIVDAATGTPVLKENIKLDENIYVYAGRAMTLSLPPITNAKVIIVNIPQDFAVPSYVKVDSVKKNDNGTTTIVTEGGNKEITFNNETNVFPYKTRNIVTVDDIIDVIDDEAASDYSGLAGVDVEEVSENPLKAASKRLPWLITLLFLGMSTASLISNYESLVSEASILAVFISLITGTAGNAGTQSLAVAVRRLAMKDEKDSNFGRLILSEVLTGLVTGAVTGLTIMIVVGVWQHNLPLGFVIGMAMLCAITVANLAGSLIPMLMDKLGFDPAVASGPFITTLSDLTSVLIYFNIANMFMRYFV